MNMNDKEWNEIWDNEPEEDEDDYNDIGSDIDANNDETFDNAAEWNEDEHEELIARDLILSHKTLKSNNSSNHNNNNNSNNNNNNLINSNFNNNSHNSNILNSQQHHHHQQQQHTRGSGNNTNNDVFPSPNRRHVLTVDELEQQLLQARISNPADDSSGQTIPNKTPNVENNQHQNILNSDLYKRSGWSPFGGKDLFASSSSSPIQQSLNHNLIIGNQLPQSLSLEQQQQILMHQHYLLQRQQQQLQIQQELHQMAVKQAQIEQEKKLMSQNPQCFTVEELERQMFAARSSSSKQDDNPQPKHFALLAMQQQPQQQQQQQPEMKSAKPRNDPDSENMIHTKHRNRRDGEKQDRSDRFERQENKEFRDRRDYNHRDREHKEPRESRNNREPREFKDISRRDHRRDHNRESRDHNREYRDNHQHHHHNHEREPRYRNRRLTIIPPQVQLKVLEKAHHSMSTLHSDEFLQDRLPSSEDGFLFKRHSIISDLKPQHDGILTEHDRNWLTKIQEKIQADYDDNLDQDYYYLLYFNRSSMTDEASHKPCGPGVLDRRFIPRERLLYNSST